MENICCICGEISNQYIYKLNCSHAFHYNCLVESFKFGENRNCPVCRSPSDYLPMINSCKGPINHVHFDYNSSLDHIDQIQNFQHKRCDHIITRGKNKGSLCNKKCVTGFFKCSNHL